MKVNLFEIKDEYGYDSNWWKHIRSKDFGYNERLQNMGAYEVEENDILYLNQRAPEGYFEKFWFIVTSEGLERTDLSEVKDILSKNLIEFVKSKSKLPQFCVVGKLFKNKKVQIEFQPNKFDKIIMKYSPGDFGIEDVQEFFQGLDTAEVSPITESIVKTQPRSSVKSPSQKQKLFAADQKITIHNGKIVNIEENIRKYEDEVFTVYILHIENGVYELEGDAKTSFESIIAQISENLFRNKNPKIGDAVFLKGRTKNDWNFGDIIHNIRTLNIL
jgi:hypothetical protein